jgi:hypothetical protein
MDTMTLKNFVEKYSTQTGCSFIPQIEIICSMPFEFNCYESWKAAYSIRFLRGKLAGKCFEWFERLDEADKKIQEFLSNKI